VSVGISLGNTFGKLEG